VVQIVCLPSLSRWLNRIGVNFHPVHGSGPDHFEAWSGGQGSREVKGGWKGDEGKIGEGSVPMDPTKFRKKLTPLLKSLAVCLSVCSDVLLSEHVLKHRV